MPRRFIALTSLAAGAAIAVMVALATPALAKGTTQASITGPGLARPVTVSVAAESEALPEQGDALSGLADQTGTLTRLGIPAGASLPSVPSSMASVPAAPALAAAPQPNDTTAPAWLIATIASAAAIVIAGAALWLRRHPRPATDRP